MINQVFVPAAAEFLEDTLHSFENQQPLVEKGYKSGLMLFIREGRKGVTLDSVAQKQYSNLKRIKNYNGAIITMLSNTPLEEIDFLHNPQYATEHVKRGVDFTKGLPVGERRIVTFHLNSLVTPTEYKEKSSTQWRNEFHRIVQPVLHEIAQYSLDKDVEVKVETVPVPEFGDISFTDERTYRGVKWNELRCPFYLTSDWGFEQIYETGLGICLDLCHNRTVYEMAKRGDPDQVLHEIDREKLAQTELSDDVKFLQDTDVAHVNDGDGIYSKQEQTVHREGLALGSGDISRLPEMIKHLNQRRIAYVLEINEIDYRDRINTKASIDYILANC